MKSVFAPHLNKPVKLGRLPRKPGLKRLHLSDFIQHAAMPPIPDSADFSPKGGAAISDVMLNDELGCCVVSAGYHLEAVATGNATGTPFHATQGQIVRDYSAIGGYQPGHPETDNGCNEETAFAYWRTHGFANGTKLLGAVSISAASAKDVRAACFLFENVFFGVGLPDSWIDPFPSGNGFVWDQTGGSDPNNGHAFLGVGYGSSGVKIDTWGLLGTITYGAIAAYAGPSGGGELYALLTPDMLAKGQAKAPNGIAWNDLIQAFDSFGGDVPVPAPAPVPVGPSLAQMKAWAGAGLSAHFRAGMSLKQAEAAANAGLAVNWPY